MDQTHSLSLSIELKIIRVRNINLNSTQHLFVRCYLSAGSNKSVKLDTQEISSKSNFTFNQTFSLDCLGSKDAIKRGTIVFELRQRRSASSLVGWMIGHSKLLARADEMSWNDIVVDGTNVEIEKWVVMVPKIGSRVNDNVIKPPAVLIAMKVEESERKNMNEWNEYCGCNSCVECEFLAIGAALEAF